MTAKRLNALEQRARSEFDAHLERLSDEALHALYVDRLRREGHEDPEGQAERLRNTLASLTGEELQAVADGQIPARLRLALPPPSIRGPGGET